MSISRGLLEYLRHLVPCRFTRLMVTRWCYRWLSFEDGIPQTLGKTLDSANPEFYPGVYVAIKTLLAHLVSTCAAERSLSSMKRLKTPLRSVASDATSSSLSVIHVHKHKETDFNEVISDFAGNKDRRLPSCLERKTITTSVKADHNYIPT